MSEASPPAGKQQKPGADRTVSPRQAQVGSRELGGQPVHPVAAHGVGDRRGLRLWQIVGLAHKVGLMQTVRIRLCVDHPLGAGQSVPLTEAQAHYLFGVMRLGAGDAVLLFNGRDGEWRATVAAAGKRGGSLRCDLQTRPQGIAPDLWLVFAPVKKARTDFIVEKAVELGVAPAVGARVGVTKVLADAGADVGQGGHAPEGWAEFTAAPRGTRHERFPPPPNG